MSKASSSPGFFARLRGRANTQPDAADLGTAFGLDLSLCPPDEHRPAPATGWQTPVWVQRLAARGRPIG